MYSWKTIRTFCIVLLLLPLVHLMILLSWDTMAMLDNTPTVWQDEMEAFIAQDDDAILPDRPVEVIGGRRVSLWRDLAAATAPLPALRRPLGDATVKDLIYYRDRLVDYYRPRVLVLLPGNSEFHIRESNSASELVDAIQELARLEARHSEHRLLYVFPPLKTVLFPDDYGKIDEVSAQLTAWADTNPRLRILDPNPLLASADGSPNPAHFRADGVQLNEAGYLRLSLLLREQLRADYPEHYPDSGAR